MTPRQAASALRDIASKIDRSTNPDFDLVASAIKKVMVAVDDQVALPKSGTGKSMLKKMLADAGKALDEDDDAGFKSLLEKMQKHAL